MTRVEILREAAQALAALDAAKQAARDAEARVTALCRDYDAVSHMWGTQPHHLRGACEASGLMEEA